MLGLIEQRLSLVFEAPDLIVDLLKRTRSGQKILAVVRRIEDDIERPEPSGPVHGDDK
jgi:hypothetical protein